MRIVYYIIIVLILLKPAGLFAQAYGPTDSLKSLTLDEVSIIGQGGPSVYSRLARKVTIITGDEIRNYPAASIQDLLEYVASVDIRQRNIHGVQADVQLRGGSFDQVLILLNGINITDPQTGHFNLDLPVELTAVERIEIVHGSGARIYGANAYKGVINIITKKKYNYAGAGISYGKYNYFHSHLNANLNKGKLFNGISFSRNTSSGFTKNTDYRLNHLYYQGGLSLQPADIYWQAGLNAKAFGANDFYSPSFPEQYEETSTGFSSLSVTSKGKIKLSASAYWRRHKDHFLLKRDDPGFYENYHLTDVFGLKLGVGLTSGLGSTFLGIEDRYEIIRSTILGNESSKALKIRGTDSVFYTKYYDRNNLNTYFQHSYTYNNFSISGGFLVNIFNNFTGKADIFPGLEISQRFFDDKLKWYTSVNRSLRLPTFTDLFYKDPVNEGNIELYPEELIALESGFESILKNFSIDLTFFRDQGKKVIDWVWIAERSTYKAMNISEIITGGLEVSGKYEIPNISDRSFRLKNTGISYTYIRSQKTEGDYESKYSMDYLKHRFRLFALLEITKSIHANLQLGFNSRNGSYLDYDADNNLRFEVPFQPYWLTDVKVYYSTRYMRVFASISNLFDTKYTDVGNLIQPGRWMTGGIEFSFRPDK